METMARSVLCQVCKLVDEDSTELRLELSRLMAANSALTEKVNALECELTVVRSDAPKLCKSYHSVGVQTACDSDGDAHDLSSVSGSPTIEGIFGKDWCMNLWKDRDPYNNMESVPDSLLSSEKSVVTMCDQITMTEMKEKGYMEDAAGSDHRGALDTEEHDESMAEEAEQLSANFSADGRTVMCSLSCDQDREEAGSAGSIEEPPMQLISIHDTEEAFSTHIIPIEVDDDEDEEDDDVQFVEESQQEPILNAAGGPSHNKQQTLISNNSENSSAPDKDSHDDCNTCNVPTTRHQNRDKFTCRICSRTFFHKGTLTQHMKSHKSNFCNICKQHFLHRNKLNSHTCVPLVPAQRVILCLKDEECGAKCLVFVKLFFI
ncbi:hypothetical protein D9C73_025721 [Collichthys lucidus]|uniref:C2H2-type domain-containing protein n=1 Tax=Collichthys lucidus TaxID=240159 RepID=A0A4U5VTQ5_COLLU|nr:hypothetical protein D9C73_025721 [Collichthys lucidus]